MTKYLLKIFVVLFFCSINLSYAQNNTFSTKVDSFEYADIINRFSSQVNKDEYLKRIKIDLKNIKCFPVLYFEPDSFLNGYNFKNNLLDYISQVNYDWVFYENNKTKSLFAFSDSSISFLVSAETYDPSDLQNFINSFTINDYQIFKLNGFKEIFVVKDDLCYAYKDNSLIEVNKYFLANYTQKEFENCLNRRY